MGDKMTKKIIIALFPLCVFIFIGCSAQQPVEPIKIDQLTEEQKNTINEEYNIYFDSTCDELVNFNIGAQEYIKSLILESENRSNNKNNVGHAFFQGAAKEANGNTSGAVMALIMGTLSAIDAADFGNLKDSDKELFNYYQLRIIALNKIMEDKNCTK